MCIKTPRKETNDLFNEYDCDYERIEEKHRIDDMAAFKSHSLLPCWKIIKPCYQPHELHNASCDHRQRSTESRLCVYGGAIVEILVQGLQSQRHASTKFEREFQVVRRLGHESTYKYRTQKTFFMNILTDFLF